MSGKHRIGRNGQYRTYQFTSIDPVLRIMADIVRISGQTYKEISQTSGVSQGTLSRWFSRKAKKRTRYPQFRTVMAVAHAVGKTFKVGNY